MFSSKCKFTRSGGHRLLAFTMVGLFMSLLPLHQAMASTLWTVTVMFDATTSTFHYKVVPNNNADCHYAHDNPLPPLDPPTFKVCAKDTVQFVAATPPQNKNELLVVIPDKILDDDGILHTGLGHNPTQHFHVSDGEQSKGGFVSGTPDGKEHKYCLLVVDKDSGKCYCWDPKIIIGT